MRRRQHNNRDLLIASNTGYDTPRMAYLLERLTWTVQDPGSRGEPQVTSTRTPCNSRASPTTTAAAAARAPAEPASTGISARRPQSIPRPR
ncbi:hypothetical protein ACGFZG_27225 [Streptomyces antibioticus]|uniref:hypothetical protein n=1 Tax=Streptomyces antibioticus TaxID=1890 RepID=UPI0036FC19B4